MRRVVVHIDRLVLRGVRPEERHAFAKGLHAELARLLAQPDAAARIASGGTISNLRAGKVSVAPGAAASTTGAGIARRIGQAIRS